MKKSRTAVPDSSVRKKPGLKREIQSFKPATKKTRNNSALPFHL